MNTLDILAKTENLDTVMAFVDERLEKAECPMKIQMQIDIAVEEIFVNIASYAYSPGEGPATVRVNVDDEHKFVDITFIDNGVPYDPLAKEDPDIMLSGEERGIGGLGIFMVKNTMDEMEYEYRDGCNRLTLRKKLN
jgi:anti-sigma regulatory factor (Ser/Thr protein kinase)